MRLKKNVISALKRNNEFTIWNGGGPFSISTIVETGNIVPISEYVEYEMLKQVVKEAYGEKYVVDVRPQSLTDFGIYPAEWYKEEQK